MKAQRFIRSLTKKERQDVEKLFRKGPSNRVRKRANAIRLSALGYSVTQIPEVLGCNRQSIHNWFDAFESQGCQGLFDKPRSGRPATATPDYRNRLIEVIKANPKDMGYPFTVWCLASTINPLRVDSRFLLPKSGRCLSKMLPKT